MANRVFATQDTVMFGDVDSAGIGHFVHQLRFLERAEYLFMKEVGCDPKEWFIQRFGFPRVRIEVDYVSSLHFADELALTVQVGHLGDTSYSLVVNARNLQTQQLAMKARMVMVVIDPQEGRPVPIPTLLREAFQPYLAT